MTDNVHNSNQRLKLLYLHKILTEETDELHPLTVKEIISRLASYGITAERKTVYTDIEALKLFGVDIVSSKGSTAGYCVVSRDFELPELKLLADAISSSRFLTERKSTALIKKLGLLASTHEARQIQRQLYVANRIKSMNESIYRNVDVINRAIDEGRQISFKYFDYTIEKAKRYREGGRTCHPYALAWENENYYLIGYNDNHNDISNFRVDRMEQVEILNEPARKKPKDFDVAKYVKSTFSMFSGEEQTVKLRFSNEFIKAYPAAQRL